MDILFFLVIETAKANLGQWQIFTPHGLISGQNFGALLTVCFCAARRERP
jgi:hypothetical protein